MTKTTNEITQFNNAIQERYGIIGEVNGKTITFMVDEYRIEATLNDIIVDPNDDDCDSYEETFRIKTYYNSNLMSTKVLDADISAIEYVGLFTKDINLQRQELPLPPVFIGEILRTTPDLLRSFTYVNIEHDNACSKSPDTIPNHVVALMPLGLHDNGLSITCNIKLSSGEVIRLRLHTSSLLLSMSDLVQEADGGWIKVNVALYKTALDMFCQTYMLVDFDTHMRTVESLKRDDEFRNSKPFSNDLIEVGKEYEVTEWYTTSDGHNVKKRQVNIIRPSEHTDTLVFSDMIRHDKEYVFTEDISLNLSISNSNGRANITKKLLNGKEFPKMYTCKPFEISEKQNNEKIRIRELPTQIDRTYIEDIALMLLYVYNQHEIEHGIPIPLVEELFLDDGSYYDIAYCVFSKYVTPNTIQQFNII